MKLRKIRFKGEYGDTYRANAYSLKCMFVSYAVLAIAWVLDLLNIFIVDLTIMNIAFVGASVICLAAFLYATIVGLDKTSSSYVVMTLFVLMGTVICSQLAYHTTLFMFFPLVCSIMYFDRKIAIYSEIMVCLSYAVSILVGFKIGLCDSNMILLTYTDSATHIAQLLGGTFEVNQNMFLMFLYFVFPKWLIIFAISPTFRHVVNDIKAHAERETLAKRLAEVDGLTGLHNRTKYLQEVENYRKSDEIISVLFYDVNNLKVINDTMGHEYGDILICGLADILSSHESQNVNSYRIGGDEFVTILSGDISNRSEDIIKEIEKDISDKKLDNDIILSVAIGFATGISSDIDNIVKIADESMYKVKAEMKLRDMS